MRKLVATLAFLAVVAVPATALAQPHWYRGGNAQVTVYVERTRVGATNWSFIKRAGTEWARSSRIRVVFVNRCPLPLLLHEGVRGQLDPPARRLDHPQLRPENQYRLGTATCTSTTAT